MRFIKNYTTKLTLVAGVLFATVSACKKDDDRQPTKVSIDLPASVSLNYGKEADIALPADLLQRSGASFTLDFKGTDNIEIGNGSKLYDKLEKAVTINRSTGKIHIDTRLLYPNGAVSSISGTKIPEEYRITVAISSKDELLEGSQTLSLKVTPAKANVKGLDNTNEILHAYVLYSDKSTTFELEAPDLLTETATWYLPAQGNASSVASVNGNQLLFSATAGDPKQKAEQAYDLFPALQKDGFTVASRQFRVFFIPQIKFFYGTYYPEYNLTQITNLIHIALANGYKSAAPTLYPEKYKSTFSLVSIEKDGQVFDDKDKLFEVNGETGSVIVKPSPVLKEGKYKFIVKALTTTGLTFTTDFTLVMSAGS